MASARMRGRMRGKVHQLSARRPPWELVYLAAGMKRGSAWVVASFVVAAAIAPSRVAAQVSTEATPADLEQARQRFREGVAAAESGRWDVARDLFRAVLAVRSAPLVHFNYAIACRNTGQVVLAIEHFRRFVLDPSVAADTARIDAARTEIAELTGRLAHIRVVVSGDVAQGFLLDTRRQDVALLGEEIAVDPGPHVVAVEGRAGDSQTHETDALREGSHTSVTIALAATAPDPVTAPVRTTAPPRTQSFGHWVSRPGPGGRWVEWAAQAPAQPSVWERKPFTLALGVGLGSPVGVASLSMRYFPQPWFGVEVAGGGPSSYGAGFLLHAHVRMPLAATSYVYAPGLFVGPGVNLTSLQLTCAPGECDGVPAARVEHVTTLSLDLGTSHEWRLGSAFTLRFTAGLRWIVNRADLRAVTLGVPTACQSGDELGVENSPCGHVNGDASGLGGFVGLDIGYGIGP